MAFTAGSKIRASDLNRLGNLVARNLRTTNLSSSSGATPVRVLSVRGPVKAGRTYKVTSVAEFDAATVPATSQNELRYTVDDTEPTVTSTIMQRHLLNHTVASVPSASVVEAYYTASSDGFLRVVLCLSRALGSGNVTMDADPGFPCTLTIEDVGDTVSTSGTVY